MKPANPRCSFCGRKITWSLVIISGPSIQKHKAYICEDCVAVCAMVVLDRSERFPKEVKP